MGSRSIPHRRRLSISLIALATALFFIPGVPAAAGDDQFPEPDYVNCPEESLQAAIDAASPGDTVYLSGTCVENVVIDKDLTIDAFGGGHIDGGGSGPVVHILSGVGVGMSWISIDGGVAEYGGAIYNEGGLYIGESSIGGSRATIAGGAIYNAGHLTVWDSGIDGGVVVDGGGAGGGGGIYNLGTATIGFARFGDNAAPRDSGGAILNLGVLSLWDVGFEGNRAKFGGAIASGRDGHDGPTSMMFDAVGMSGNEAILGGAIRLKGDAYLTATGLFISGSQAVEGGAISADGATIELADSTIGDNSVAIGGGGIALRNGSSLSASGLGVGNNTAAANGGGILAKGSTVKLVDSQITNNTGNDGGGISNDLGSSTTLLRTVVAKNTSHHFGGGVFNTGSDIWIRQSTVSENAAVARGGGVANRRGSAGNGRVWTINSTIARNASPRGAAIDNVDAFVGLDHATITENTGSAAFFEDKPPAWTAPVNSILAGNAGGDCEWAAAIDSGGGNVFGDCFAAGEGSPHPTDISGVADPQLTPFFEPSGYLHHYEPAANAPAVNRVPLSKCTQDSDIVGNLRPMGSGCDSGSLEAVEPMGGIFMSADFEFGHVFTDRYLSFTGRAQDDKAVKKVLVGIKDRDRGLWLQDDKTTWGSFNQMPAELSPPGASSTAWTLEVALSNGEYSLAARAFDYDGNWDDIVPYRHFVVAADVTPPYVDADFAAGSEFVGPGWLTGRATDRSGIDAVRLAIRDRRTKLWLQADKVSWGPNYYGFDGYYMGDGGWSTIVYSWYFEVELPIGQYNLSAMARDREGNWGEMSPYRAFDVIAE
jgi:predicted outer membrane repeat protein